MKILLDAVIDKLFFSTGQARDSVSNSLARQNITSVGAKEIEHRQKCGSSHWFLASSQVGRFCGSVEDEIDICSLGKLQSLGLGNLLARRRSTVAVAYFQPPRFRLNRIGTGTSWPIADRELVNVAR